MTELHLILTSVLARLDVQALVLLLLALLGARAVQRVLRADDNPVKAWHFYASKGAGGQEYGDPKKLALMVGIFASTFLVGYMFWAAKEIGMWEAAVFAVWLIFVSAVDVFSAWARSFVDRRFGQPQSKEGA